MPQMQTENCKALRLALTGQSNEIVFVKNHSGHMALMLLKPGTFVKLEQKFALN